MKQPWNLFRQKAPPWLSPIFHSSNDPDTSANAVGWRSVHGWQREKKQLMLNFGIVWVKCSSQKKKNSLQQLQQSHQWNLKLIHRDKLLTLNISAWLEMLGERSTTGWMEASPVSPRCRDLLTFPLDKTKSCCSLPHSGLLHPPAAYTKLNTRSNGWLKHPPPLLHACGTTQTKPTLMLQSHLCQLASHCQAQLFPLYHTLAPSWGCKQAPFTPHR